MQFAKTSYNITLLGEMGVDIFFVVSGAIMTIILWRKPLPPLVFLKKRCIRILPLYWLLSFALYIYIVLIRHGHQNYLSLLKTITLLPIFDQNSKGAIYFDGVGNWPLLAVGWTLAFEFWFYIIVATSLFFSRKNALVVASILLVLLVIVGVLLNIKNLQFNFITDPLIIEFVFGCICGWFYINSVKAHIAICYALLFAAIIIIGVDIFCTINYGTEYFLCPVKNVYNQIANFGTIGFLLVLSLLLLEKNNKFKVKSFFLLLGDISYSTYLVHVPIMAVIAKYYQKSSFSNAYLYMILCIVFCIWAGYLVFTYIEKPLMQFCHKIFDKPKRLVVD